MPISLSCTQCNRKYQVRDELAGKVAKCQCGQNITIPVPAAIPVAVPVAPPVAASPSPPPVVHPGPAAPGDLFGHLDAELAAQPAPLQPLGKSKKRAGRKKGNPYLIPAIAGGAVVVVLLVAVLVVALSSGGSSTPSSGGASIAVAAAPPAPNVRWATPEAVFEAMKTAVAQRDWKAFTDTWSPEFQRNMVRAFSGMMVMVQTLAEQMGADMGSMWGDIPAKYGFDKIPKPSGKKGSQEYAKQYMAHADQIADKQAFLVDLMAMTEKQAKAQGPMGMGGMNPEAEMQALKDAQLLNLKVDGDKASATISTTRNGKTKQEPICFVKIDGEWRVEMDLGGGASRPGNPGFGSPPGMPGPAAPPGAAGTEMPPGFGAPPGFGTPGT